MMIKAVYFPDSSIGNTNHSPNLLVRPRRPGHQVELLAHPAGGLLGPKHHYHHLAVLHEGEPQVRLH